MTPATATANPYTLGMAQFVAELTCDAIPAEVRQRAKLLMLDALGCALYGARLEWCRIVRDTVRAVDSSTNCRIWGTPFRTSAPHAALVNGTQVQSFELDDVHRQGILHCGAVVLPALIAITEIRPGMSGRDFLAAAVAGYEIGPRVGLCMGTEHIRQGWHSGATVGVFSAAAGAARGLGLDTERTVHALGIGGTQSAGLMAAQYGAMVKRMHAGRSSQSGLYGALLAEGGFTGITNVFESEYGGFCTTFSRSTDRFTLGELTAGLGKTWQTMGVALKFYACVGSTHTTLDALRALMREHRFTANDVEKIRVWAHQVTVEHAGWPYRPESLTSAQLNLPYCIATMLLDGDVFVDQFTEEKVADPQRMALAGRVDVLHDPEITALHKKYRHRIRIEVRLKDGRVLQGAEDYARGSDVRFASEADIVEKFDKLAAGVLPAAQVARIRDLMLDLENVADAGELARQLATV